MLFVVVVFLVVVLVRMIALEEVVGPTVVEVSVAVEGKDDVLTVVVKVVLIMVELSILAIGLLVVISPGVVGMNSVVGSVAINKVELESACDEVDIASAAVDSKRLIVVVKLVEVEIMEGEGEVDGDDDAEEVSGNRNGVLLDGSGCSVELAVDARCSHLLP